MKLSIPLLTAAGIAALLASPAGANEALAKKYNCMACHQVAVKAVGPAYKDVAKKYKGQADAPAKLEMKVAKGGAGVWGPMPMPPNDKVPAGDIKALVDWILKQ
jgi:cytochrome c